MTSHPGPGSPSAVVLGRVGAPHGVQGWVKVTSYTEPAAGIAGYPQWTLVHGQQSRQVRVLDELTRSRGVAAVRGDRGASGRRWLVVLTAAAK